MRVIIVVIKLDNWLRAGTGVQGQSGEEGHLDQSGPAARGALPLLVIHLLI